MAIPTPDQQQRQQAYDLAPRRHEIDGPDMREKAPYTDIGTVHHRDPKKDLTNYRDIESGDESQQQQIDAAEHGTGSVER